MSEIYRIHDREFLWFVQAVFYAHQYLSMAVLFVALVCMPSHRIIGRFISWLATVWALACLIFYNAWQEAPTLAWLLVALLLYRTIRWLCWVSTRGVPAQALRLWPTWLRPRAQWIAEVIRDYFRVDPRGVYWLDLARAIRGQSVFRTRQDRHSAVPEESQCPPWRQALWTWVFHMVDFRIWLYQRLPRFWHRPHRELALDEYYIQSILGQETTRAEAAMLRSWTGRNFREYYERSMVSRRRHGQEAALFGRKYCLHRETSVEHKTFRDGWQRDEAGLLAAATECYVTWRDRCRYDILWFGEVNQPEKGAADSTENGGEEATFAQSDVDPETLNGADGEPPAAMADGTHVEPVSPEIDSDPSTDGQQQMTDEELATDEELETVGELETDGEAAIDEELDADEEITIDNDLTNDDELATAEGAEDDGQAETELFEEADDVESVDRADRDEHQDVSDDEMFAVSTPAEDAIDDAAPSDPVSETFARKSDCQNQRQADLVMACRLLEAYVGIQHTGDFERDVREAERRLAQSKRARAALMLLMIYCLRDDFAGGGVDQQKVDLLNRLGDRFIADRSRDKQERELRRLFRGMYLDALRKRGEFPQIVEFFSDREAELGEYERRILADAKARLAKSLTDQEELRDMLRYDAIGLYFEAGFCPMWTLEYAQMLFDNIRSMNDLDRLFCEHPVEIPESSTYVLKAVKPNAKAKPRERVRAGIRRLVVDVRLASNPSRHSRVQIDALPFTFGSDHKLANYALPAKGVAPVHVELLIEDGKLAVRDITKKKSVQLKGKRRVSFSHLVKGNEFQFGNIVVEILDVRGAAA